MVRRQIIKRIRDSIAMAGSKEMGPDDPEKHSLNPAVAQDRMKLERDLDQVDTALEEANELREQNESLRKELQKAATMGKAYSYGGAIDASPLERASVAVSTLVGMNLDDADKSEMSPTVQSLVGQLIGWIGWGGSASSPDQELKAPSQKLQRHSSVDSLGRQTKRGLTLRTYSTTLNV
jgi:hypothetical protein